MQAGTDDTPVAVRSMPAFGTTATVAVTDHRVCDEAVAILAFEIAEMDVAASRFRPDSEVRRLSVHGCTAVRVSPLLFEAVAIAVAVAEWTGGAVDPTVGRSVEALGYDRDFGQMRLIGKSSRPPSQTSSPAPAGAASRGSSDTVGTRAESHTYAIRAERTTSPGWRNIEIDAEKQTILLPKGTLLDLGASAKALTADRAAAAIARKTGSGALVSIGGDISTAGAAPADGWCVGIAQSSSVLPADVDQVVAITSGGIASSSTAVRKWSRYGRIAHHIVDPATGENPSPCWSLVSVAGASCVEANAASTAAILWGADAIERLGLLGLPARLVAMDGDVTTICGWPGGENEAYGEAP
jgi:FAD:protein FMN transferase